MEFIGRTGVDLFFVISGFIIARTISRYSPGVFVVRRWWRVAPMFYLASLPFIAFAVQSRDFSWEQMAATLLFWPAWSEMQAPFLILGWTLSFEMLFYIGAASALTLKRKWPLAIGFVASCVAASATGWPVFRFLGNPILIEFALGILVARVAVGPPRRWLGGMLLPLAAGWLIVEAVYISNFGLITDWRPTITGDLALTRTLIIGIPAALVVYGALQFDELVGRGWKALVLLGDASYSLYLCHPIVQLALQPILAPQSPDLVIITVLTASVLAAVTIHRYIELPLLRALPNERIERSAPVAA